MDHEIVVSNPSGIYVDYLLRICQWQGSRKLRNAQYEYERQNSSPSMPPPPEKSRSLQKLASIL
jgi:hypothetical protein